MADSYDAMLKPSSDPVMKEIQTRQSQISKLGRIPKSAAPAKMSQQTKMIGGHQRVANIDGHGVNESYKQPSAHWSGRENASYMHPQVKPTSFETAWKTADKALAESHRPAEQQGRSKSVFAVNTEKTRGAPKPPNYAQATRAKAKPAAGAPGSAFAGPPQKPMTF
jgi:hypothetical protein